MSDVSILETIRDRCVERMHVKDDFRGVTVISRKKGNLFSLMLETMAKSGVCIIVSVTSAMPEAVSSERVFLNPVSVLFEISENVTLNQASTGTRKGAMYLAERIAANFQMWRPLPDDPENGGTVLVPVAPGIIELPSPDHLKPQPGFDPKTLYLVAVHFETTCTVPPATP